LSPLSWRVFVSNRRAPGDLVETCVNGKAALTADPHHLISTNGWAADPQDGIAALD
jgi:hypothetical protein